MAWKNTTAVLTVGGLRGSGHARRRMVPWEADVPALDAVRECLRMIGMEPGEDKTRIASFDEGLRSREIDFA